MSLGVRFAQWPRPVAWRLLPALRYLNLMRALERRMLTPWIQQVDDWRVLDVGCGHGGIYSLSLAQQGATLVGCDLQHSVMADVHTTAQGLGLGDDAFFLVADGAALPLPLGDFDLVICNCVLEHIIDDMAALEAMARVLRPGGLLYLTVDNADHGLALGLLERLPAPIKSRFLQPKIGAASSVVAGLDEHLDELYSVRRRYHQPDLEAVISDLGLAILYSHPYLFGVGAAHYELFHALRRPDTAKGFGRMLFMTTSLLLYPLAVWSEKRAGKGGHGLAIVARKERAAHE
jgi:SAM-dependent methyltransferase